MTKRNTYAEIASVQRAPRHPDRHQSESPADIIGIRNWLLPANLEGVRCCMKGSYDGDRQMVKILAAVLTDGLAVVEAACAEALAGGTHAADVVLNRRGGAIRRRWR